MIGARFAPLTICHSDTDMDTLFNIFNTEITDSASEIPGKQKPCVTAHVLNLCDKRELKKKIRKMGQSSIELSSQEIKKGTKRAKDK